MTEASPPGPGVLDALVGHSGEWLRGSGPETDIVISTRIRLARNVADFPFLTQASAETRAKIETSVRREIEAAPLGKPVTYLSLGGLEAVDRTFLVERHLISRELAGADGERGLAFTEDETLGIMVNEEDHLRIQVLRSGFDLGPAFQDADRVDDLLEARMTWAFSPQFGYLTSCPTNVGTAMRISVMLHLPALVMAKQVERLFAAMTRISFTVRGLYGEGTQATGDFYQISNQATLGKTEAEIVADMNEVVPNIARFERTWREKLLEEHRTRVEDKVFRAIGILRNARVINSEETLELLSYVRLGVHLKLVTDVTMKQINEIFLCTQPAHLQKAHGRALDSHQRDEARAAFVRSRLETCKT